MTLTPPEFERKIVSPAGLAEAARALPRPLVFTNGVFDLLHRGHVTYLARARALGLGKGDDRPINRCEDRMAVLAALGCIDLVTVFEEDTPLETILRVRPDVLVKGGDWALERIVGAAQVTAWGGTVHAIAFEHERSTTAMLARIRQAG